jgi:hypothetical protein
MSCTCRQPRRSPNPRAGASCVVCGRQIAGGWVVGDEQMAEFFEVLALPPVAPDLASFREHCLAREGAGREKFGFQYLARDNDEDGMEEAADLANYACFGNAKMHRTYWDPEAASLRWQAAKHAAKAHHLLKLARAAERGATLYLKDEEIE